MRFNYASRASRDVRGYPVFSCGNGLSDLLFGRGSRPESPLPPARMTERPVSMTYTDATSTGRPCDTIGGVVRLRSRPFAMRNEVHDGTGHDGAATGLGCDLRGGRCAAGCLSRPATRHHPDR